MTASPRSRFRRHLALAAIAVLSLVPPAAAEDRIELVYWNWAPHIDQVVEVWNKANPDIHVTVSRAATAPEIVQKLSAAATAGNPPDVTNVNYQDLPALIVNGLVADLTAEMATQKDKIAPIAWNLVTFDGTTWAAPQGTSPMMFFYRRDILEEAGVAPPTTWDEFAAAARALRAAGGSRYLATFASGDPATFAALTQQAGAKWWTLSDSRWAVNINSAPAKKVAAYWQALVADDAVATIQPFSPEWGAALTGGHLAGIISAVWAPPLIENIAPGTKGKWGVVPLPRWNGDEGATFASGVTGGSATAVSALTKHPDAAKKFAVWINNNEEALAPYVRLMNIWPARLEARDLPQLRQAPAFLPDATDFYRMAGRIDAETPIVSWGPNVGAAFDVYRNAMGDAVRGKAGFAEVLDRVQAAVFEDMKNQGYEVTEGED